MPEEELLPKPQTDLPLPEKNLPLPEKELNAKVDSASQGEALRSYEGKSVFKSKFFLGFMGLSFLIAFLIGGFFISKEQANNKTSLTSTVTQTPSPSPTIDPTKDWKTYTNTKYGISFSYPNEAIITEKDESGSGDARKYLITISLKNANGKSIDTYYVQILKSTFLNTKAFINSWFGGIESGPSNVSQTTINNQPAYKLFMAKAAVSPAGSASIVFQKGTTVTSISNETKNGTAKSIMNDQMLNKISSTFKFTDSTSITNPTIMVNNFYKSVIDCQRNNYEDTRAGKDSVACPKYNSYSILDKNLISKIDSTKGYDLVLCAQNFPLKYKTDNTKITGNTASTVIHTYYGNTDNPILVDLNYKNSNWYITNITCKQ